jgi:imidazolonepropionase-like amidohydrolase
LIKLHAVSHVQPVQASAPPVPAKVRHIHAVVARKMAGVMDVRLAPVEDRWVVAAGNGDASLEMSFERARKSWALDRDSLRVLVEGEDRSEEVKGDVMLAMAMILGAGEKTGDAPATIGETAGPASRPTSLQVRNTHVIRN